MILHLAYNRSEVHSYSANVYKLQVPVQIGDDVFEEKELFVVFLDFVVLLYVFLA